MNRLTAAILGLTALLAAASASALTIAKGVVYFSQADALAGGVTPGDTPGFPVTISVAGVYKLASNLLVSTAVSGIEVSAPEVTIDLAGFRVDGSGVGVRGIDGTQRALTVGNGTIRGFVAAAIYSQADYVVVDHTRLVDNPISSSSATAVNIGNFAAVTNSNLSRNGLGGGINCFAYCRIQNNIIAGTGVFVPAITVQGFGSILTGNTVVNFRAAVLMAFGNGSFGDNVFIGNAGPNLGNLLPLNPNLPYTPVP